MSYNEDPDGTMPVHLHLLFPIKPIHIILHKESDDSWVIFCDKAVQKFRLHVTKGARVMKATGESVDISEGLDLIVKDPRQIPIIAQIRHGDNFVLG